MKKVYSIILWIIFIFIIIALVSLIVYFVKNGITFDGSSSNSLNSNSGSNYGTLDGIELEVTSILF